MSTSEVAQRVAELLGQDRVWLERIEAGASRGAYSVSAREAGSPVAFLLVDDSGGGDSGSTMDLAREAALLRRLALGGVPVPEVLGVLSAPPGLLMEFVDGHARLEPGEAEAVGGSYMAHLAEVHRLDPASVFPDCDAVAEGAVRAELDRWVDTARRSGALSVPLVAVGASVLHRHRPTAPERAVVVHGDAGAGNFLVHDGEITALLDWEMSHAGDWHEDLGWLHARSVMTPFGELADRYAEYEMAAGVQIDPVRLRWCRALAAWKCVVAVEAKLRAPDPGTPAMISQLVTLVYQPVLASLLLQVVGGEGEIDEPDPVPASVDAEVKILDEALAEPLGEGARSGLEHLRVIAAQRRGRAEAHAADLSAAGFAATDDLDDDLLPARLQALGRDALRAVTASARAQRVLARARERGLLA